MYENSPVLSSKETYFRDTGYKGTKDIKRLYSGEEVKSNKQNVILEIDGAKLEKTGIYQCISQSNQLGDVETSRIKVFFKRTVKSYGQYYIATLDSGEKIPVFIDDSLVPIKKNTIVQLPIGNWNMTTVDFSQYVVDNFFDNCFLDCASGFATGPEMQDFRFMEKMAVLVIIVVMVVFLGIVLGINIGNSRK